MGDGKAFQFANEIKQFLQMDGYNVSCDQSVFSKPVIGQFINPKEDGFEVEIGTQQ